MTHRSHRFLARKPSSWIVPGLRVALWHVIIFPPVLKTLSEGALVAGMHKHFLASWLSLGKFPSWTFQRPSVPHLLPLLEMGKRMWWPWLQLQHQASVFFAFLPGVCSELYSLRPLVDSGSSSQTPAHQFLATMAQNALSSCLPSGPEKWPFPGPTLSQSCWVWNPIVLVTQWWVCAEVVSDLCEPRVPVCLPAEGERTDHFISDRCCVINMRVFRLFSNKEKNKI